MNWNSLPSSKPPLKSPSKKGEGHPDSNPSESQTVSLAEIKDAVDTLSPGELAELASFIRQRENAAWDRQIDADFAEGGRLRPLLDEVREDIREGRLEDLP